MKKFVVGMILGGLVGLPVFAYAPAQQDQPKTEKTKKKTKRVKKTSKKKAEQPKAQ